MWQLRKRGFTKTSDRVETFDGVRKKETRSNPKKPSKREIAQFPIARSAIEKKTIVNQVLQSQQLTKF